MDPTPLHELCAHSYTFSCLYYFTVVLPTFIFASRNLKIGYFSQHHVEQLDLNVSAVELLARKFPGMLGYGLQ